MKTIEDIAREIAELANETKEDYSTLVRELFKYDPKREIPHERRIERIKDLALQGKNRQEIADKLGLSYHYVSVLVSKNNISIPRKTTNYSILDDLILEGLTKAEMHEKTGLAFNTISKYISSNFKEIYDEAKELRKRKNPKSKRLAEILELLHTPDKYFSEVEVADELSKTHQAVNQLLHYYGLTRAFEKKRNERGNKLKEENLQKSSVIIPFFKRYLIKRIGDLSWPEQKAFAYLSSLKYIRINGPIQTHSFETLTKLFEVYSQAKASGENISFKKIGEQLRISPMEIRRVLKSVGEHSLYWEQTYRPRISYTEKQAIERGIKETVFSLQDLAYFLDRPGIFNFYCSKKRENPIFRRRKTFSYSLASQIYEAQDLGFKPEEIAELLGKKVKKVNLISEKREEIEESLIESLRRLYGDQTIDKPYVDVKERVTKLREKNI